MTDNDSIWGVHDHLTVQDGHELLFLDCGQGEQEQESDGIYLEGGCEPSLVQLQQSFF
jgi:hypothetical protein